MRKLILLLLISLGHKSTQNKNLNDNADEPIANYCADCHEIMYSKSYFNTGHYCHPEDKNALGRNYTQGESMYPRCLPSVYEVVTPIRQYCCFWSPQLGCSALIGEKHYDRFGIRCTACTKFCSDAKSRSSRMNYGHLATIPLALTFLALLKMLIPFNQLG